MAFVFSCFGIKTKQITLSFGSAGTKQMKTEEILALTTKTKQTMLMLL
jgi:hypothetical protein